MIALVFSTPNGTVTSTASAAVLGRLSRETRDLVVTPGELIMLEGDTSTSELFVVVEGTFEILAASDQYVLYDHEDQPIAAQPKMA